MGLYDEDGIDGPFERAMRRAEKRDAKRSSGVTLPEFRNRVLKVARLLSAVEQVAAANGTDDAEQIAAWLETMNPSEWNILAGFADTLKPGPETRAALIAFVRAKGRERGGAFRRLRQLG